MSAPAFAAISTSKAPVSDHLEVRDDPVLGKGLLQLPDGIQPFALDERGPGLDPIRAAFDGLPGRGQGPGQVLEIERDLENRTFEPHRPVGARGAY